MEKRLKMKWLAIIFAIAAVICSFGTGNMPQINNIATSVEATFNIPAWITGLILAVPNLFGIILPHKEMKQLIKDYWAKFKREHPEDAAKIRVKELRDLEKTG